MQKILLLLSAMLLIAQPKNAASQDCITGEGNIFNETVLIGLNALNDLSVDDRIVAYTSDRCVGSTPAILTNAGATAIPLTVWLDNDHTSEVDGVLPGERIQFYGEKPNGARFPLVYSLPHEPDGIYVLIEAAFDPTMTALLDSLELEIAALDDLIIVNLARADSLQGVIDTFPDVVEMQDRLDASDARIVVLENDITEANTRLSGILVAIRFLINQVN